LPELHLTPVELPTLIALLTVWVYWTIVAVMVVRRRRKTRKLSGVLPEQRLEVLLWLAWVPVVVAWLALPWLALTHASGMLAVPAFARSKAFTLLRWVAAATGVAALHGSIRTWREMGRHWTMAVTRDETSTLLTAGTFGRVRHPVYAQSIALMLATFVVLPTWPMFAVAVIHVALMLAKARNEERFLLAAHGDAYVRYCSATGRFIPRMRWRR